MPDFGTASSTGDRRGSRVGSVRELLLGATRLCEPAVADAAGGHQGRAQRAAADAYTVQPYVGLESVYA